MGIPEMLKVDLIKNRTDGPLLVAALKLAQATALNEEIGNSPSESHTTWPASFFNGIDRRCLAKNPALAQQFDVSTQGAPRNGARSGDPRSNGKSRLPPGTDIPPG